MLPNGADNTDRTSRAGARVLRIMHVITGLYIGGAEGMLERLVLAQRARGHAPMVVSLLAGGPVGDRLRDAGIEVLSLGIARGFPDASAPWRLARLIRARAPDVVQSWMYHADLVAALGCLLSGRRRATRLIWGVRCSNMDLRRYGAGLRIIVDICSWLAFLPDAVVANSYEGREFHQRLGYRARSFVVIDNGIDVERFRPDEGARRTMRRRLGVPEDGAVVAMVARLDPMKGHDTFCAALDRLPGVTALAIGAGTERLAPRPGLLRLGQRTDVAELLAASDVFVSSSRYGEGFSNAVVEAMAAGVPAVVTDVGDSRRIVADTGRVVPPGDPDALARGIRELLAEVPEARIRRRELARRRAVENFSLARAAAEFEALYARVLGLPRQPRAFAAAR